MVDERGEVIASYRRHLSGKGQPGVGDAFFKWLCDRLYDSRRVDRVAVASAEDGRYPAWPADATLQNFDRANRIFVALVLSSPKRSRIVNAVDSDDREYARPLKKLGVRIEELCPNCLK